MTKDPHLIDIYKNKKDLYASVGSAIFHKTYWECMEKWEDGTPNPEGKELRSKCKQLILATLYGMGAKLMAENMKVSVEECKEILNEFFKMFPSVKEFTEKNEETARNVGYVEDYLGRRRHLPDAMLPEIEVRAKKTIKTDSSVIFDCDGKSAFIEVPDNDAIREWTEKFKSEVENARNQFDAKNAFKEEAKRCGIELYDNGAFISKTMTQCTNARIQGGASTLTKKAMINISNDPIMKKLGFKILIPIHDELLGECPEENAEECEKRLAELMIGAAKPECSVPMKVDTYVVKHWYEDEVFNGVRNSYKKRLSEKNESPEIAYGNMCKEFPEICKDIIKEMCDGTFNVLTEDVANKESIKA